VVFVIGEFTVIATLEDGDTIGKIRSSAIVSVIVLDITNDGLTAERAYMTYDDAGVTRSGVPVRSQYRVGLEPGANWSSPNAIGTSDNPGGRLGSTKGVDTVRLYNYNLPV